MAASPQTVDPARDTFPKLVADNGRRLRDRIAIREKDLGIWQSYTWREYLDRSRQIALGLAALGCGRGDKVAIVGDNRPQLYWAMLATQALGGVPVPLYQDSIEREMQYVVDHAEARFAVVEDQEQVDKLLHVRAECPRPRARDLRRPAGPPALPRAVPREPGRAHGARRAKFDREHPGHFDEEVAKGRGDDVAIICYTSGTTGQPKGTMLSHRNLIVTAASAIAQEGLDRGRGGARVSPDGLGRRPHVLLRAVDRGRLHHQLPGERGHGAARPPGDRPHVLLRARRASGRTSSPR